MHEMEQLIYGRSKEKIQKLKPDNFFIDISIITEGFHSPGRNIADFTIIKVKDEYHIFYIDSSPGVSCVIPGNEIFLGHSSTKNFQHFRIHEPSLSIVQGTWEGAHLWAPHVLKARGLYWMFYTGLTSTLAQSIGVAISDDLYDWRRIEGNPVFRPNNIPEIRWNPIEGACRDPHILKYQGGYYLYATVDVETGLDRESEEIAIGSCPMKGLVCAWSQDLIDWRYRSLAHIRPRSIVGISCIESPWVSYENDKFLLLFGHADGLMFSWSDNPEHFADAYPLPGGHGVTGIEFIESSGDKRLVSFFTNGIEGFPLRRLLLGILTITKNRKVTLKIIEDINMLKIFNF